MAETPLPTGSTTAKPYWSPYLAGFCLGLVLLASFWLLGTGLGASAASARLAAWCQSLATPNHVLSSDYFGEWFQPDAGHPLKYYLVFMSIGVLLGGFLSARSSGRILPSVERGPVISAGARLGLALAGGVLVGFASRLARGCTSGQALSGSALLFTGSVVFLVCVFVGAYATAYLVRREWL
jgi:hypothetical protein